MGIVLGLTTHQSGTYTTCTMTHTLQVSYQIDHIIQTLTQLELWLTHYKSLIRLTTSVRHLHNLNYDSHVTSLLSDWPHHSDTYTTWITTHTLQVSYQIDHIIQTLHNLNYDSHITSLLSDWPHHSDTTQLELGLTHYKSLIRLTTSFRHYTTWIRTHIVQVSYQIDHIIQTLTQLELQLTHYKSLIRLTTSFRHLHNLNYDSHITSLLSDWPHHSDTYTTWITTHTLQVSYQIDHISQTLTQLELGLAHYKSLIRLTTSFRHLHNLNYDSHITSLLSDWPHHQTLTQLELGLTHYKTLIRLTTSFRHLHNLN